MQDNLRILKPKIYFQRLLVPARVEAYFTPAAHYLTEEPVATDMVNLVDKNGVTQLTKVPINAWAPIRSTDNCYAFGAMTAKSKCKMVEAAGHGMHVVIETENRHVTYLQCPTKVRKGEIEKKNYLSSIR